MNLLLRPVLAATLLLNACASPAPQPSQDTPRDRPFHVAPASTPAPFVRARAIIVLRHADISVTEKARLGNATPLLPRGQERARELLPALKDAGITRIITSTSLRTQQTAAPLAAALHLTPETPLTHGPKRPAGAASAPAPSAAAGIQAEADALYSYLARAATPDDTVLVVYHHSIIPSILTAFGYHEGPIDDATEFDRLYVILPDSARHTYRVLRLRYNGAWPDGKE
jgi:broad specificity phosphatase PhoE